MDIPVALQASMDYTLLRESLKKGDFRAAEDETRALLIRLAGPEAVKRGWVYFTEVGRPAREAGAASPPPSLPAPGTAWMPPYYPA